MDVNGVYKGFSPTDESGVGLGELEVTISDSAVSFRFATGHEVRSDSVERSAFRQLTDSEVADRFNEGADTTGVHGFTIGDDDGPIFLFFTQPSDDPQTSSVVVQRFVNDEVDSVFGYTQLWRPDQVAAGHFDTALAAIEKFQEDPGVIPRIDNNGKRLSTDK